LRPASFAGLIAAALTCGFVSPVPAATVLFCPLDSLDGWSIRTCGAAAAEVVAAEGEPRRVQVTADPGTVLLSRELPLDQVCGARLTVNCLVENRDVVRGPQASSCGKLHLAIETPEGTQHHSVRFAGSAESRWEGITADVPATARRVVLNLGLEACRGQVRFERLLVKNDRRGVHPLDLTSVFNGEHEQLGLPAFPEGTLEWNEIPFQTADASRGGGSDCLRLRGVEHPDWPARTTAPIPVDSGATAIYILHGALGGQEKRESPAVIWKAQFVGGHTSSLSVFEGREIGAVGQTTDLENWQVAWRGPPESSPPVTVGVTKWIIYNDTPIESLSCQAYRGASPVVLAVTVVEEPPPPPSQPGEFDDMGDAWEMGE
jgi:hypothetical protein